jgi:fatty-acyl-CoA synthase
MRHTMMDFPLTIPTLLERAKEPFGDVEIVSRFADKSVRRTTYGSFYKRARALAEGLLARGLRKGDRVATLMWNHESHLVAYFGIPIAGGVLHTLNLRLSPDDVAFIAEHAGDRFLIVDESLVPLLEKCPFKKKLEAIFVVGDGPVPAGYESFESLLAAAKGAFEYPDLAENDAMGMCYTSGTTGRPKGVVYSHRSTVLHCFATAMADGLAVGMRDTILPVVPQFHVNAWGIPYSATMVGAKLVLPGPFLDAVNVLDLLEAEHVTLAAGVPTVWLGIIEALEREPSRWKLQPGLRMVVGGSAVPESMLRRFDAFDMRVIHAWGMTETSPIGTVSHVRPSFASASKDEQYGVRAKQGINVPFVEMRIVDDAGKLLPRDGEKSGELEVRGPWVAARYYDPAGPADGAADGRWSPDGWFRTGDVATIDPHGHMKITDRAKDVIKSGGEWISSVDLENALMGHPEVREACVVAIPHEKWAERPLAVVVVREGSTPAVAAELHALLASKFVKWWLPDGYVFVDSIPRTSAGKFLKAALREEYKTWTPAPSTLPPAANEPQREPPAT